MSKTSLIVFYSIGGAVLGYLVSRFRYKYKQAAARAVKFERAADAARSVLIDCPRCCAKFNEWLRRELNIESERKDDWPEVLGVDDGDNRRNKIG